jgi:hypothetical protein
VYNTTPKKKTNRDSDRERERERERSREVQVYIGGRRPNRIKRKCMVSRSQTQVADGTQLFGTPGKEGLKIGEFVDASGGIDLALLDQSWQRQVTAALNSLSRARSLSV